MRITRALFAIGLFFLATGFTNCDYFEDVTIPTQDRGQPTPFGGIWQGGQYQRIAFGPETLEYEGRLSDEPILFAGGTDPGGVRQVTLETRWTLWCGVNAHPRTGISTDVQNQPGSVGDVVSNGVFALRVPETCEPGIPVLYTASFKAIVVDFNSNAIVSPTYYVALR